MKFAKITLSVALLGALTLGMADDTATVNTTVSVDAQIEAIQTAPAQERVQLMNEFKQKLMTMNQEDRMAAIQEMQSKMQAQTANTQQFGRDTATMAKDMTRTRTQEMQAQTNEQMNNMQNMNQQQAGSQFMQTGGANAGSGGAPSMNTNMMQHR